MFFNKTSETEQISQITGYLGGSLVICLNIPLIIKYIEGNEKITKYRSFNSVLLLFFTW